LEETLAVRKENDGMPEATLTGISLMGVHLTERIFCLRDIYFQGDAVDLIEPPSRRGVSDSDMGCQGDD
jgi:hypothetical protein